MKQCPNCGKEVPSNSKFCTYCGFKFDEQPAGANVNQSNDNQKQPGNSNPGQPTQRQEAFNEKTAEAKQFSSNYFQWFMDTLKHPTRFNRNTNQYFGLTSLIISVVLIAILINQALKNIPTFLYKLSTMFDSGSNSSDASSIAQFTSSSQYNEGIRATFTHVFAYSVVALVLAVLIPFLIKKVVYHDSQKFLSFTTEFATESNYVLLIEVLVIILLSLNMFVFASLVLTAFISVGYTIAFYYSLFRNSHSNQLDSIYAVLIGVAVQFIVAYLLVSGFAF
ncbi:DUF6574 domain-containing protein [Nicoliella lavandulae]|uniref:DUF6574 domain-containing protein n=1 Tax=Nicoliella lavandulae TaxID=3082954 RepID=A0ABU8SJ57_9LACO